MIYFSQQIAQMKQIGKSLRSCLSASPSACLAHADYIFMAHTDLTNLTDGKSLRPCLSAAPSACLAHAENADFASRYALAASGMYTLGETPTHASLRCVLREIREICVRQKISERQKTV